MLIPKEVLADEEEVPLEPWAQNNIFKIQFNSKEEESLMCKKSDSEIKEEEKKSNNGEIISSKKHRLGNNCVSYAREKVPEIPQGMWGLKDKKDIINSDMPEINAVAITPESIEGHLAVVIEIEEKSLIIAEGNYLHGYETVRRIDKTLPLGYFTIK